MEKDEDEEDDERLLYDIFDYFLTLVIIIMGRLSNEEPFKLIDGQGQRRTIMEVMSSDFCR